jgi:glycosyltransferase involved in cell wall biosynthesis
MTKIAHIITGLETGGAEMMLYKLLSELVEKPCWKNHVVSLIEGGPMGERIRDLGVPVSTVSMARGRLEIRGLFRLFQLIREHQPDIIQTWMYHADLLGGIMARLGSSAPIIWNIRSSTLDPSKEKRSTILTAKACAFLSKWIPARIVTCAQVAAQVHADLGYDASKMRVIPNGFDTDHFHPDPQAYMDVRCELRIAEENPIVGMVGRFHAQKNHEMLVRAAHRVQEQIPDVQFVLCGDDVTWENMSLTSWIKQEGLEKHFHLLGRRDDIPRITASFDIAVLSSSFGEAFPNVVGEAMACGVPCVVTDVGDAAAIVGDTGRVVSPDEDKKFAEACIELLNLAPHHRKSLGQEARQRVVDEYSLPAVARMYCSLYGSIVTTPS